MQQNFNPLYCANQYEEAITNQHAALPQIPTATLLAL